MEETKEKSILLPRNDAVFKNLFGKHPRVLKNFLIHVVDLPETEYEGIKYLNTEQRVDPESKLTYLDIKVETATGILIDIEMQVIVAKSLMKRILYYLAQMYVDQLKEGEPYDILQRKISLLVANEIIFDQDNHRQHRFILYDCLTEVKFYNLFEINVLELPKSKQGKANTPLDIWMRFIAAETEEELMQLAQQDAGVHEAYAVLKEISLDEKLREEARYREKAWRDEFDRIQGAKKEGRQEGHQDVARTMLSSGYPPEEVSRLTKIPLNEVVKLM